MVKRRLKRIACFSLKLFKVTNDNYSDILKYDNMFINCLVNMVVYIA